MIRKYNYTGRRKIALSRIFINQLTVNGTKEFDLNLNIQDLDFPDHARIYVEPYFKASYMRFDFGTVARIRKPEDTRLTDIPITDKILYRVKIVDESEKLGLILGYSEEISPTVDNQKGGKRPILPVNFIDLGNRVWQLEFLDEGPILFVNHDGNIENIREIVSKDIRFLSFVYPEVIRQIALKIASDDGLDFEDPYEEWQKHWLSFFRSYLFINYKPTSSEYEKAVEWSNEVSDAFCKRTNIIKRLLLC